MPKTNNEKIDDIQEKINQLENQKKQLRQKQKADERRARTHRLIERGAILESFIPNADKLENEQIKSFLEQTMQPEIVRKILDGLTPQSDNITSPKPWSIQPHSGANVSASTDQGTD